MTRALDLMSTSSCRREKTSARRRVCVPPSPLGRPIEREREKQKWIERDTHILEPLVACGILGPPYIGPLVAVCQSAAIKSNRFLFDFPFVFLFTAPAPAAAVWPNKRATCCQHITAKCVDVENGRGRRRGIQMSALAHHREVPRRAGGPFI